ncbi:MAG: PIN domain-containing protein [Methanoculleus sp.]|nr:PIN domain-containing protein [Methanoculleus sp.]
MEAEAVIAILNGGMEEWELVGSEVIEYEIAKIQGEERRRAVESLLQFTRGQIMINEAIMDRARTFNGIGIDAFDALHLATAESVGAVFLTTDDALVKVIMNHADKISIKAYNPVKWLMEVTDNGSKNTQ